MRDTGIQETVCQARPLTPCTSVSFALSVTLGAFVFPVHFWILFLYLQGSKSPFDQKNTKGI